MSTIQKDHKKQKLSEPLRILQHADRKEDEEILSPILKKAPEKERPSSFCLSASQDETKENHEMDDTLWTLCPVLKPNYGFIDLYVPINGGSDDAFTAASSSSTLRETTLEAHCKGNVRRQSSEDGIYCSCVCGMDHGKTIRTFGIMCDFCGKWHKVSIDCVGFDADEADRIPNWFCHCCDLDESDEDGDLMREELGSFHADNWESM